MTQTIADLPVRRPELVVKPSGDDGTHVVKDPRTGSYFRLGPAESFLLLGLDDARSAAELCAAYEARFGESLTEEQLGEFLDQARELKLLTDRGTAAGEPHEIDYEPAARLPGTPSQDAVTAPARERPKPSGQSILFWRKSVFDPDALFDWLEPKIRFVWTGWFLALSAAAIVAGGVVAWQNRFELITRAPVFGWEVLLLGWVSLVIATTLHEFAHGLTCKHYGGEVHEVGFLLIYFTPCFYCNVSDAWLFREKSKRLWVTLAGGYLDLILWAVGLFVWRLTLQETRINYVAWVVLSVCGVRTFFNFNPLLKLDGYYLLSDLVGIPNLRQRAWDAWTGRVRWLLWGAPRPAREERGRFLLWFGVAAWAYGLLFLAAVLAGLVHFSSGQLGWFGTAMATIFCVAAFRGVFQGFTGGEVRQMVTTRHGRVAAWGVAIAAFGLALTFVPAERRVSGAFQVRSAKRIEVHAPISGFLKEIQIEEGSRVDYDAVVAVIEVPNLPTDLRQKQAEVAAAKAKVMDCEAELRQAQEQLGRTAKDYALARRRHDAAIAELDQAKARRNRALAELDYLSSVKDKTVVRSPEAGVQTTPHLKERVGQYVKEGDLICTIEETGTLVAEVKVPEQDVARVRAAQEVEFKARALPFETFRGVVERVAPAAVPATGPTEVQGNVTVYCLIGRAPADLRPGMSGEARVRCGRASVGGRIVEKVMKVVRTEFWW